MTGARRGSAALGSLVAALALAAAHLPALPHGGVSEYHGEVVWNALAPGRDVLEHLHPGEEGVPVLDLPGGHVLERVGPDRILVLRSGDRVRVLTYHPFMVFLREYAVDVMVLGAAVGALPASPLALKVFSLLNLCVYAAAAYAFARSWLGPRTAALAALLLAVDPMTQVLTRALPIPFRLQTMALLALVAFERERASGSRAALLAAGSLLGLGLTNSLIFAWALLGVGACLAATGRWRRWGRRGWSALGAGLALGGWPILAYNLLTAGTFEFVRRNLGRTDVGVDTLSLAENLGTRTAQAVSLFDFAPFLRIFTGLELPGNPLGLPLFVAACVVLGAVALGPRPTPGQAGEGEPRPDRLDRRRAAAILGAMAAIWACTPFTLSSLGPHHMAMVYPFPHLAIAAAALHVGRRGTGRALAVASIGLWLALAARFDLAWAAALARTGGPRLMSDTSYALAHWLDAGGHHRPHALQPQPYFNALYYTEGRVRVRNPYGADFSVRELDRDAYFRATFADPEALYVRKVQTDLLAPVADGPDPWFTRFTDLVDGEGLSLVLERRFPEPDGRGGYEVYRVEGGVPIPPHPPGDAGDGAAGGTATDATSTSAGAPSPTTAVQRAAGRAE